MKEQRDILDGLAKNNNKNIEILYITPESLLKNPSIHTSLSELVQRKQICLFAIDEAHCISTWGQDFRPSYRKLDSLRRMFPHVPIMAYDVANTLHLRAPKIIINDFDRPNLYLEMKVIKDLPKCKDNDNTKINKNNQRKADDINLWIKQNKFQEESGLIYTFSRKSAENISSYLKSTYQLSVGCYHAGMPSTDRNRTQYLWQNEKLKVIVATSAFGMGINKLNVRYVIHCDIKNSLEGYYQEIGRAGRDSKPSNILLYYSLSMINQHKYYALNTAKRNLKTQESSIIAKDQRYQQVIRNLEIVKTFAESEDCRRKILLNYMNDIKLDANINSRAPPERCCDYCSQTNKENIDNNNHTHSNDDCKDDLNEEFPVNHEKIRQLKQSGFSMEKLKVCWEMLENMQPDNGSFTNEMLDMLNFLD